MEMNRIRTLLAVLLSASLSGHLAAQSTETPAKLEEPKTSEEVVKLENFEVNAVPIEKQILPTSRPFNSVFGTDDNIVDVPRNVTIISRQQLSDINISSVLDFTKLTSSSYTTTNFGAPSNPSIRGQTADLFINGVRGRTTSNGNGLPLDFNSVESVNIVKGPATAVQGTSMYVGGFVDLITKRPYFDSFKGSVSATIGSYSQKEWNIDVGGPLSKQVAYRFSYSGTDSGGYWHDYYNKNNAFYGALTFRPSDTYEVFFNASANWYRYTENWGLNRPTQDLIDNGNYITGINNNNAPGAPSDPQNSVNVNGGPNSLVLGPTVTIDRHNRLLKPSDHSTGREFNAQAIQTFSPGNGFKVVNNSYFSYTARNTLSSYYYSEIIDPSWFVENRTEFIVTKSYVSINAGLDLKYQRTKAYDDYFFEPANVWDLTKDPNYINVYNATAFYGRFVGQPVPGWPNRYATQGAINGDTNDSHGTTVGPFFQATWKLNDKFNFVTGVRYDHLSADVKDPVGPFYGHASISVWDPNYNTSLVFKMTPTASAYVTYNYSKNISGAVGNGGGITGWDGSGSFLDKGNFMQPAELMEVGTKFNLSHNKLFLNFAYFDQSRTSKPASSTALQKYKANGFETELNYQPDKHLYATVSFSYIHATTSNTAGAAFIDYPFGGPSELVGNEAQLPFGVTSWRTSGLPEISTNALVSYSFDNGWGFSANALVTGPINNNNAGTLVIPTQYEIDASIWYRMGKKWEYRVSIGNVTDQKNWAPPNNVYGNGSILALAGTTVSVNVKYNF
jgi:catecholate siderophore receptor